MLVARATMVILALSHLEHAKRNQTDHPTTVKNIFVERGIIFSSVHRAPYINEAERVDLLLVFVGVQLLSRNSFLIKDFK